MSINGTIILLLLLIVVVTILVILGISSYFGIDILQKLKNKDKK